MGVPKFAAWLTKKYPSMVVERCPADVHGLYIDLNGLIHPCCHDEHDPTVALRTQEEKLRSICLAIETLVVTVRPRRVLYIAIDGVAPRAKMNQQRARRYMSAAVPLTDTEKPIHGEACEVSAAVVAALEKEFTPAERDGVERELDDVGQALQSDVLYGGATAAAAMAPEDSAALAPRAAASPTAPAGSGSGSVNDGGNDNAAAAAAAAAAEATAPSAASAVSGKFDSNCISPGTEFMEAVAVAVREYIRRKLSPASGVEDTSPAPAAAATTAHWADLTVVFSDSSTAGEGEHKFLDFLRTQSAYSGFNSGGSHVIAGLDADLIFLSLSLHIPRVVLLRDHERSTYAQALLPDTAGGTKRASAREAAPSSAESSSRSTAADDVAQEGDGEDYTTASCTPSPSPAPPQHIADMVVPPCTAYEYFDMDVVGASVVSEVYQLCLDKGIQVRGDPLECPANCTAANGFRFHTTRGGSSSGGSGTGEAVEDGGRREAPPPPPPPPFHPCTSTSNSKIVDDFIVLGMLLGNDFLPHLPSVYCGESAMDTLMDVYVGAVLPHGYLTGGEHEIQLVQLERLLRAYAAVEATRLRQYCVQSGAMTSQAAATSELCSTADRLSWRATYVRTTSLRDEAGVAAACRSYVEGLRFVWRYYSSISRQVNWTWYYPFHHAPLAYDVADFIAAQGPQVQTHLAAPALLDDPPPSPFCQLLCILPPRSRQLVPAALHATMTSPPAELADTFPRRWAVDNTGAYGKAHLAAVLLPFSNLPRLQEAVVAASATYTAEEARRNSLCATHLVLERRPAHLSPDAAAPHDEKSSTAPAPRPRTKGKAPPVAAAAASQRFCIQGGGVTVMAAAAVPDDLRDCPGLICSAMVDVVPPLSRPRCYSYTVPIPSLTLLPDGTRVAAAERRPPPRRGDARGRGGGGGGGRGRGGGGGRRREEAKRGDGAEGSGGAATAAAAVKFSVLFLEFAVCLVATGVLAAAAVLWRVSWSLSLPLGGGAVLLLLLQLCGVAVAVLGTAFALGLAVAPTGRSAGSGVRRHNIFTAFVDWQCSECLSLNFSRNRCCFVCRAPYDPHRCVALFSSRHPPEPPLMDADHSAYTAFYGTSAS
ncbi:5'-3' exoribonuclease B [Novymonas esmeraldas]|uniref:5'-3' exoribonuclease B n=1 Tax=Novymonas esmeraldas TaxID=1808958 RepID=A0AAW0ERD6_9TRYP